MPKTSCLVGAALVAVAAAVVSSAVPAAAVTGAPATNLSPAQAADVANQHKAYAYELPLASPVNDPTKVFIGSWSFGNREWDPKNGMPVDSGPSPDYHHSLAARGQDGSSKFPASSFVEQNPNEYVSPPPTGVNTGINERTLRDPRFVDTRLNANGEEVGLIRRRQMRENIFPTEGPFHTNTGPGLNAHNGGGLMMLAREPAFLEAASGAAAPCVNCEYL